tara:strand:+ start:7 stop:1185 length:1179 start_codon:yes stop_codon:yes gene_type:complete
MKKKFNFLYFIVILFSIIIITDHVMMRNFGYKFSYKSICYDKITVYNYCKNSKHYRYLENEKTKSKKIITKINNFKIPYVKEVPEINPKDAEIIIMGDSFIMADEINVDKRLGNYFRENNVKAVEMGYASWSPYQYSRILKNNNFKDDAKFLIFLMTNDFLPSYKYSSYNFSNKVKDFNYNFMKIDERSKSLIGRLKNFIKKNSYIANSLSKIKQNKANEIYDKQNFKLIDDNLIEKNFNDCSFIKKYNNKIDKVTMDYVFFSRQEKCWNKIHKTSLANSLNYINQININLKNQQEAYFFLIPSGWAIPYENTGGKSSAKFMIKRDVVVSHIGLSKYLENKIENFFDLEPVLNRMKNDYPKPDSLYFYNDGHWTEQTHKLIYKWVSKILLKN